MSPSKNSFFACCACAPPAKPMAATETASAQSVVFFMGRPFQQMMVCYFQRSYPGAGRFEKGLVRVEMRASQQPDEPGATSTTRNPTPLAGLRIVPGYLDGEAQEALLTAV